MIGWPCWVEPADSAATGNHPAAMRRKRRLQSLQLIRCREARRFGRVLLPLRLLVLVGSTCHLHLLDDVLYDRIVLDVYVLLGWSTDVLHVEAHLASTIDVDEGGSMIQIGGNHDRRSETALLTLLPLPYASLMHTHHVLLSK